MRAGSIVSVSAQVKACELDAVIVAGNRLEDVRRDALCGFALVVARGHAVHVGVVDQSEAFVDVHRERVGGGNHKDALSPVEQALPLKFAKASDEVRRDRRLRICFGGRGDWMARLRGASFVGAWAWRLGFEVCAPTGGIVWRLRARGCVGACDGLAPMSWASWLQERFESLLGACVVALLLCAKGLERAFDEGLACRAHRAGEGCELV